jgi:hypothetical protein
MDFSSVKIEFSIFWVIFRNRKFHPKIFVVPRSSLPLHPKWLCGISRSGCYADHIASPIDPDKRYVLFGQPRQHIERNAPGAVQENDALRNGELAFEEVIKLLLLRIMGQAVAD